MGFLDHSTNNVILDAVLTDKGRELLSQGAGTFNIAKFAFGDDEVDYGIIEEFGRTVGKEKIEKLTPVLEASTSGYLGVKYRNVSLNNNSLTTLPILSLVTTLQNNKVELDRSTSSGKTTSSVTVQQSLPAGRIADPDVADFSYRVTIDNTFLSIENAVPDTVDSYNNATYTLNANSSLSPANLSSLTFTLVAKSTPQDIFDTFSHTVASKAIVSRVCKISGANSGQFLSFDVEIS